MVAGRQYQQFRRHHGAILQQRALGHQALDIIELQQADLAADDEAGAPRVEVVAAAPPAVLHLVASPVLAHVMAEAARLQPVYQRLVELRHPLDGELVAAHEQRVGRGGGDEVAILQRR
ncbi:hypothetical protein, partial [Longimicrobium sp.]|uniref:hypothetical protein n=1 Tax=Longimicrobium sp. TaxID=2029185 RepID=UPI002EDA2815